jgi:hypothetical protein
MSPSPFVSCFVSKCLSYRMYVMCIFHIYMVGQISIAGFFLVLMIYLTLHRGKRLIFCDSLKMLIKIDSLCIGI